MRPFQLRQGSEISGAVIDLILGRVHGDLVFPPFPHLPDALIE